MKGYFILLLLTIPLISCTDADDLPVIAACGVNNPIQELDWLREEVANRKRNATEDSKYCYIVQAMANDQTIFLFEDCNPLIDKVIPVINCSGASVGLLGDENYPTEIIVKKEIIYRPSDFKCTF